MGVVKEIYLTLQWLKEFLDITLSCNLCHCSENLNLRFCYENLIDKNHLMKRVIVGGPTKVFYQIVYSLPTFINHFQYRTSKSYFDVEI